VVSHGPRTAKVIALTFDDGYNDGNVALIRQFLVRFRVNATFFPTARAVELAPDTWQRVAAAGFPIANHTYHHLSLAKQCFDKQVAELEKAKSVVGAHGLTLQGYMRPPFEEFDRNTQLAAAAAGEGYVVLWNVDTLDWTGLTGTDIARRAIGGGSGTIILMHTSRLATTHALSQIVSHYRNRGYTFVTIGQILGVPGPVPFP
jgi:peptidoglycan/xylan/chitin deacetylase (PgdA/CDA1 family)